MMRALVLSILTLGVLATAAHADPCKAIPDKGPMPAYLARGSVFSGPVVYVGDGDGLCVSVGPRPGADWVEVRIADFYAPELHEPGGQEAKATLARIAMGRVVRCVADHQSYDRVVARCELRGISLGQHLRQAGVSEGGRGR